VPRAPSCPPPPPRHGRRRASRIPFLVLSTVFRFRKINFARAPPFKREERVCPAEQILMTKVCPRNLPLLRFFDSFPDVPRFDPIFFLLFPPSLSLSLSLSLSSLSLYLFPLSLQNEDGKLFVASRARKSRFPRFGISPAFWANCFVQRTFPILSFCREGKVESKTDYPSSVLPQAIWQPCCAEADKLLFAMLFFVKSHTGRKV
jgi:hypothetical protein